MSTLTFHGTLVVTRCWCGIGMALPADLYAQAKRHGTSVWCPLGHQWVIKGRTLEQQLADEQAQSERRRQLLEDERDQHRRTVHRLNAYKGEVTKVKKAVHAGRCPWCKKSYKALAAHMAAKHPDVDPEAEPDG